MQYKGYLAKIDYDEELKTFHGEVVNLRDVVTFEADNAKGLEEAFHESVDDYLGFCADRGEQPERPYSGNFQVRIAPDLHRAVSDAAKMAGKSLNTLVVEALSNVVAHQSANQYWNERFFRVAEASKSGYARIQNMESVLCRIVFIALEEEGIEVPPDSQHRVLDRLQTEIEGRLRRPGEVPAGR